MRPVSGSFGRFFDLKMHRLSQGAHKFIWTAGLLCIDFQPLFTAMAISFANRSNADLLDQNYLRWRNDPSSVDATWSAFFEGFELGSVHSKNGAATGGAPRDGAGTAGRE